jgi:hypothetical protein
VVVVDVANVMGSRPDGWWRDRAGAATRLLAELALLPRRAVSGPEGEAWRVARVVAVLEGRARDATVPTGVAGFDVVLAPADGDTAVVEVVTTLDPDPGGVVVVVTADRGLRARLPAGAVTAGPRWLTSR